MNQKELHKKIWKCTCAPWKRGIDYCKNCEQAIIEFANENGAGALCQDIKVEELERTVCKLEEANLGLRKSLEEKNRRVEELKIAVSTDSEVKHGK